MPQVEIFKIMLILIQLLVIEFLNTQMTQTHTLTLTLKQNFKRDYTFAVIHILKYTYFLIFMLYL